VNDIKIYQNKYPKIKGLEERIQAYIDRFPESDVSVEVSRDVDFEGEQTLENSRTWVVTVSHKPTRLPE
ncbi:hypothetical protein, partial [Streptococcus sp. DD10]|uniref:hypothetical protein n=1 Tax=Streptococcus sp. DD10 TaxID=1777878 RepID=UPI000A9952A7